MLKNILILIVIILAFGIAAGSAILEAWLEVRKRPKEEMFFCHKHGQFRKKHCLPLFPELGGKAQNSFICPSCYRDIVFTNPNKKLYE
jgi:hypothetical protein